MNIMDMMANNGMTMDEYRNQIAIKVPNRRPFNNFLLSLKFQINAAHEKAVITMLQ